MVSRRLVQVVTIGLIVCLVVVFAITETGSVVGKGIPSQKAKASRAGGGSARASSKAVSGIRPRQGGSNRFAPVRAMRRSVGANRHVMAAPEKFPKGGVYIWCDPDGLWTMFWRGRGKLTVTVSLTAEKPITVKSAVKAEVTGSRAGSKQVVISSDANSRVGVVQFNSADDSVQFDILVNGKADPNRVYIGSRINNPKQFPMKLNTRRTRSNKEIRGPKPIRNQESTGTFRSEASSTLPPKRTPMTATLSYGGNSGGGKGGRKVRK